MRGSRTPRKSSGYFSEEMEKLGMEERVGGVNPPCIPEQIHSNCLCTREPNVPTIQHTVLTLISVQTKFSLLYLAGKFRKDMKTMTAKSQYSGRH